MSVANNHVADVAVKPARTNVAVAPKTVATHNDAKQVGVETKTAVQTKDTKANGVQDKDVQAKSKLPETGVAKEQSNKTVIGIILASMTAVLATFGIVRKHD